MSGRPPTKSTTGQSKNNKNFDTFRNGNFISFKVQQKFSKEWKTIEKTVLNKIEEKPCWITLKAGLLCCN